MSEPKWTPGPWTTAYNGTCWQVDAGLHAVATTQFCYAQEPEANARLIAAGPELYAALQYVFEHIEDKERCARDLYPAFGLNAGRAVEMARTALAKARGETP